MDTTTPATSQATAAPALQLPEELTIYTAGSLRGDWLAWVDTQRETACIDAAAVSQIDGAGVQLLAALLRALESRAIGWQLQAVPGVLSDALRTLGLQAWTDNTASAQRA